MTPILVFENQTGNESMEIPFLFRRGQAPGREAKARQRDSVVCEQENGCRFLNVVSRGETPRAAKRGAKAFLRRVMLDSRPEVRDLSAIFPETVCETRRTRASFTRSPGGFEDGWSSESVRVMPFYCSKRSASICVVLGPKKSSTYSSEYASGFSEPAASHLPAAPLLRNEGLLGQTPSPIARRQ